MYHQVDKKYRTLGKIYKSVVNIIMNFEFNKKTLSNLEIIKFKLSFFNINSESFLF